MRVRAKMRGWYGERERNLGDEFDIQDKPTGKTGLPRAFSGRWMETVNPAAAVQAAPAQSASIAKPVIKKVKKG